jgi:hypothetical protein
MKPITQRIKESRSNTKLPKGMEISIGADGSGGAVPEYNKDPSVKGGKCGCSHKK